MSYRINSYPRFRGQHLYKNILHSTPVKVFGKSHFTARRRTGKGSVCVCNDLPGYYPPGAFCRKRLVSTFIQTRPTRLYREIITADHISLGQVIPFSPYLRIHTTDSKILLRDDSVETFKTNRIDTCISPFSGKVLFM